MVHRDALAAAKLVLLGDFHELYVRLLTQVLRKGGGVAPEAIEAVRASGRREVRANRARDA